MGILSGEATLLFLILPPISLGVNFKKKNLLPMGKFFSLKFTPVWEDCPPGKQTGSHQNCLPLKTWQKKMEVYQYTLIWQIMLKVPTIILIEMAVMSQ